MHTQSLSTKTSLSKRHMGEFQSILAVIDERKLILFGLLQGIIRRIEKYPVFLKKENETLHQSSSAFSFNFHSQMNINLNSQLGSQLSQTHSGNGSNIPDTASNVENGSAFWDKFRKKLPTLYTLFDGSHSFDKICLAHGISQNELDDIIDRDPDVVTIWK